ncbi:hypothetical protein D3C80_2026180 [compost metagenome]
MQGIAGNERATLQLHIFIPPPLIGGAVYLSKQGIYLVGQFLISHSAQFAPD